MKPSCFFKIGCNLYPAIRRSSARVQFVSDSFRVMKVKIPCNFTTKNMSGTMIGGVIFSSVESFHVPMLYKILGNRHNIFDKTASVKFLKPIKNTVYAEITISDEEVDEIRKSLDDLGYYSYSCQIEIQDKKGIIYAIIDKTISIKRK